MTGPNLLARLRTLLDEASASFWTDAEAYAALADGQNAVIYLALGLYRAKKFAIHNQDVPLSPLLQPLFTTVTATVNSGLSTATLSAVPLELIWLKYNHNAGTPLYPARVRFQSPASEFKAANSFLVATTASGEYYIRFTNPVITFDTASTNNAATYLAGVLAQATDIGASQASVIPDNCVPAILQFAFARCLSKDLRTSDSQAAFNSFIQFAQGVMG